MPPQSAWSRAYQAICSNWSAPPGGEPRLALGASPRAALVLAETARTAALLAGRDYVLPDEVRDLARVVLPHRLVLESRSRYSGVTTAEIVEEILGKIKIPR
ncbi:AAA family ATPase [Victivallis sp.]|uniref:AAA family ATPase n=1 Tax=Victivallis sp. TaxID=2049020 RepID=UPI003A8C9199